MQSPRLIPSANHIPPCAPLGNRHTTSPFYRVSFLRSLLQISLLTSELGGHPCTAPPQFGAPSILGSECILTSSCTKHLTVRLLSLYPSPATHSIPHHLLAQSPVAHYAWLQGAISRGNLLNGSGGSAISVRRNWPSNSCPTPLIAAKMRSRLQLAQTEARASS